MNKMQLWINTVNLEILENLENILFSDDKKVAKWFMENLPGEIYENLSPQYEIQIMSSQEIKKMLGGNIFKNIKGFYRGTEQCEFLLPTLDETKKAIEMIKNFDKKYVTNKLKLFSFITPYYGNEVIRKRLIENLEYLNKYAKEINPQTKNVEIIVNDFGTLNLVKKYENLKIILGRLLVKTLKNPIVDTLGLEKNIHIAGENIKNKNENEIQNLKKKIAENQKLAFSRTSLTNKYFIKWLKNENIERAGIDYQQIIDFDYIIENTDIKLDIYYPYALIFVGRLCDTSSLENIRRGYFPIDDVCPRTCNKYDLFIKNFETVGYKIIQRGNAQYKTQIKLNFSNKIIENYNIRLIYQPLV